MTKYRPVIVPVVGLTFQDGYPGTIHQLRDLTETGFLAQDESVAVVLIRDPENQYDPNAVEVHVPVIGAMVGHLSREIAARLAPHLDADVKFNTYVDGVRVDAAHPDNPGLDVRIERVEDET